MIVHAGLLARRVGRAWRGALIEGPSGSGKSDLGLRLTTLGWRLVADDRVRLWTSAGRLFGRAPAALAGLIEARGVGVLRMPVLPLAEVRLHVRHEGAPERVPAPATAVTLGVAVPVLTLDLLAPAAPARLDRALAGARDSDPPPHGLETDEGERI